MKLAKTFAMLAAFVVTMQAAMALEPLAIGAAAPKTDVSVTATDGKSLTLKDAAGENGLLVIFSCNTCPWVIKWQDRYPGVAELASGKKVGVVFLNSNEKQRDGVDSLAAMKGHAEKFGYTFTYAVDKDHVIADAFGASKTPDVFLFDKDMKLVYRGAIDDNAASKDAVKSPFLADAINSMVAGEAVATPVTKAIGCSIKR